MAYNTPPFLQRLTPFIAFLGGFIWDALTLGQRMTPLAFARLGVFLLCSALLVLLLARRHVLHQRAPAQTAGARGKIKLLRWHGPYLLLQFFYGGIFSALFILYFKSSGHLGTWLTTAVLGALLVGNEFARDHYARRFTLTWSLFALNAILLFNFVLPHLAGSLEAKWFYLSTASGILLTHGLHRLAKGRPGRIAPAWGIAGAMLLAWHLNMVAPVPLVMKSLNAGLDFQKHERNFTLAIEPAPTWQFWREQAAQIHVPQGERLYGVSAVFAPKGITAALEHRWELHETQGWRQVTASRFNTTGGREQGFRGYSWVSNPQAGDWRLTVATQDGRIIGTQSFRVARSEGSDIRRILRKF